MLSRLRNMFRVPDLRNKILFTILIIVIYRIGAHLPVPYVDFAAIKALQHNAETNGGVVGFLDLFSGGAITSVAIFFLGIMPYITASIIMQLLGVVIPKLEQWQNEGQVGQKKITQWTRYVTIMLAIIQSTGFVFALHSGNSTLFGSALAGKDLIPHFDAARGRTHRADLDGRHRHGHVARRAHQPARHRQRHVDPDLRLGGVAPARAGQRDLDRGHEAAVLHDHRHRYRHDRRHRVRGIGATKNPGAIRETGRGPAHVRRPEHLHPAEGQPVRCDPGDLRELDPARSPR